MRLALWIVAIEFFSEDPPARATVGASALNPGAKIEVQMIAAR